MPYHYEPRTVIHQPRAVWAVAVVLGSVLLYSAGLQMLLEEQQLAGTMVSRALWQSVVGRLGGEVKFQPATGSLSAVVPFFNVLCLTTLCSMFTWWVGAAGLWRRRGGNFWNSLFLWGWRGWRWLAIPIAWSLLWLFPLGDAWTLLLTATTPFWWTAGCAGWAAEWFFLLSAENKSAADGSAVDNYRLPLSVWVATAVFVACFFVMNRQLYAGLQTPHGDSAMYEEHLWNLTHGKGFRSFLDYDTQRQPPQFRLFLGEHIQVVHVLLLPLYLLWPSHLLLELSESLALGSGAVAVFWITRRHTTCTRTAALLSCAYLLYFPMHYLDIAVDFKTFRPICFGVPLILFALDQWERGRPKTMLLLLALALSAKEDYAMIIAPLGVWIALTRPSSVAEIAARRQRFWWGGSLAVFGLLYLIVVVKFAIPLFRGGDVHYVRYFPEQLGETPGELVVSLLRHPLVTAGYLFTLANLLFALSLLLPLGGVPLLSPSRLAVAVPLFGVLCLNQIAQNTQHHFHAPLVPILFWAAGAGLARAPRGFAPRWALASSITTGLLFSLSPAGITFWDPGSAGYWRQWYLPGERAEKFAAVLEQIPASAVVASTDFVHPRFTHHRRSYDYSDYRPQVPDDTDYIVIDTRHRYSSVKIPEEVKEYRDDPQTWELLPDQTDGYFIILKRRETEPQ